MISDHINSLAARMQMNENIFLQSQKRLFTSLTRRIYGVRMFTIENHLQDETFKISAQLSPLTFEPTRAHAMTEHED
jgi:hypothetical protein